MKEKYLPQSVVIFSIGLVAIAAATLSGCGKQPILVPESLIQTQAPGHFVVPPKVDIILAEDDSGSAYDIFQKVAPQVPVFLNGLEAKGWDYHFTLSPVTHSIPMTKVTASRHDSNYGSAWVQPFPGAIPGLAGTLDSTIFRSLAAFQQQLSWADISNQSNGNEAGFQTLTEMLTTREQGTSFLRGDAMLVMIVMTTGQDTSGVNFCQPAGSISQTCEKANDTSKPHTLVSSYQSYLSGFRALKSHPADQIRFFAAIDQCRSSYKLWSAAGLAGRYEQMASDLGGQTFNLCTSTVAQTLDSLANVLKSTRLAMRTRYLFIDKDAEVSTIVVTRYRNGVPEILPQDATNGWTYAGEVTNVYTIDDPAPMNLASGWAIELHGTAKLVGDDSADVSFKPAGFSNVLTQ